MDIARLIPRLLMTLTVAITVLAWAPAPAGAYEPPAVRDPVRRIQILVKTITIFNDHDWGTGEIFVRHSFRRLPPGCLPRTLIDQCMAPHVTQMYNFKATDKDIVQINTVVPGPDTYIEMEDAFRGGDSGIPLFADETYAMTFFGRESDTFIPDDLGDAFLHLTPDNNWGYGIRTVTSSKDDGKTENGDFEVKFEIRDAPLPDLRAVNIKVLDLPGSANSLVCMSILNAGVKDPGPFSTVLRVDGVMPPNGKVEAGQLAPGAAGDLCVEVALTPGPHRLTAFVDEPRGIDEVSDTDNRFELAYTAPKLAAATEPTTSAGKPATSAGQPDLIVTGIRVRDQVPDGKDDCKEGKNPVTVVVKNDGTADAGPFVVRITVDEVQGDDVQAYAVVASADGVKAGQEREVLFPEVKLKKGQHALAAVADYKLTVAEVSDGNNDREVTVRCSDG